MIVWSRYGACSKFQNGGHKWMILSGVRRHTPAASVTLTQALLVGLMHDASHTYVIPLLASKFLGRTSRRITSATVLDSKGPFVQAERSSMHTPSRYFSQHAVTSSRPCRSPRQ